MGSVGASLFLGPVSNNSVRDCNRRSTYCWIRADSGCCGLLPESQSRAPQGQEGAYRLFALSRNAFVVRSIDFAVTRVLADMLGLASFNGLKIESCRNDLVVCRGSISNEDA